MLGARAGSAGAAARTRYLPDRLPGVDTLTAEANTRLFAPVRLDHEDVTALTEAMGLAGTQGAKLGTYSLGMRQRLLIGAILLAGNDRADLPRGCRPTGSGSPVDTRLLLLDEPTRALDADGVAWFWQWVVQLTSTGAAAVIATHDPHLPLRFRTGWLDHGHFSERSG
ncbi:MAG: ABC transporter ATP-binding protein [Actinomycetes bacterium]